MDLSGGKKIQVNVMDAPNVKCEECGKIYFEKVTVIKKLVNCSLVRQKTNWSLWKPMSVRVADI